MLRWQNPVYDGPFPDPFVWRDGEEWFAVGTEPSPATGDAVFPLLRSRDLVTWRPHGRALVRPGGDLGDSFWAPEVAVAEGIFYLYYSVGVGDAGHQLRVATSRTAVGPYRDVGHPLTDPARCAFAIDPHPFRDDDGRWYLFHARDFLDAPPPLRAGTALVVQALDGMTRLAPGEPTVVLRARHDWQRFQADREMYGRRFDWHTLEGPCVRRRAGRYWCLFSGGCWHTDTYGVDFAVADHVLGPYGGESPHGPRLLRTVPGRVLGPGHNSIAVAPDGTSELIVYHAWDVAMGERRMCLDRLWWDASGPRCDGPTWEPQVIGATC